MPIERLIQQCGSAITLLVWIAAIGLPIFGLVPWWITIALAIVWQVVSGWICLAIMKRVLPPEKYAEVVEKTKRGETL